MIVALFRGNRGAAEPLAEHGVVPRNLRAAAAGLGRLDLLDNSSPPGRRLAPKAQAL